MPATDEQMTMDITSRLGIPATVAGFGSVFLTYFMEGPVESYTDLLRNDGSRFVAYRRELIKRGIFELPMNRTLDACEQVLRATK